MPQSFYVFLYLTTISKGANKGPDLASTLMETNNNPPYLSLQTRKENYRNKCLASSFTIPSGTGFWGRPVKGGSIHSEKLWFPRPIDWNPAPLPSIPYFLPFSLSFSTLSCLSLFFAMSSSLTSLCFHVLQSGSQKTAVVFSPFVTVKSSKISKSKSCSLASGGERFH